MISAKQFLKKHAPCSTEGFMIEFAKIHVKAALKAASEKVKITDYGYSIDTNSILNSYPESNIK
jgi:hypothetical protein